MCTVENMNLDEKLNVRTLFVFLSVGFYIILIFKRVMCMTHITV